jgi:hypothetical protein
VCLLRASEASQFSPGMLKSRLTCGTETAAVNETIAEKRTTAESCILDIRKYEKIKYKKRDKYSGLSDPADDPEKFELL